MLDGGKPEKHYFHVIKYLTGLLLYKFLTQRTENVHNVNTHTWSSQWFAVQVVGGDSDGTGGGHGAAL